MKDNIQNTVVRTSAKIKVGDEVLKYTPVVGSMGGGDLVPLGDPHVHLFPSSKKKYNR